MEEAIPRSYKLHFDISNKCWSQYITDARGVRKKVLLGKGKSRTNDPAAYAKALALWTKIRNSEHGTAIVRPSSIKRRGKPNYRNKDSLNGLFDNYIQYQREQFDVGNIAASTVRNRRQHVLYFLSAFVKNQADDNTTSRSGGAPRIIRPSFIVNYYRHLIGLVKKEKLSRSTAALRFNTFKHFIRYAATKNELVNLPNNIDSREYAFRRPRDERRKAAFSIPTVFTADELQRLLSTAIESKWHKHVALWISLSLNCAWTIADLATLEIAHIKIYPDYTAIEKARQKTSVGGEWRLWPENATALLNYIKLNFDSPSPDQKVFLSKHRKPIIEWIDSQDDDDKIKPLCCNRAHSQWSRIFKLAGVSKSFRYMRKTTASAMEHIVPDHRYVQTHLAHRPSTLAGQTYSTGVAKDKFYGYILALPQELCIVNELARLGELFKFKEEKKNG